MDANRVSGRPSLRQAGAVMPLNLCLDVLPTVGERQVSISAESALALLPPQFTAGWAGRQKPTENADRGYSLSSTFPASPKEKPNRLGFVVRFPGADSSQI
jgi:hypothetical protein